MRRREGVAPTTGLAYLTEEAFFFFLLPRRGNFYRRARETGIASGERASSHGGCRERPNDQLQPANFPRESKLTSAKTEGWKGREG